MKEFYYQQGDVIIRKYGEPADFKRLQEKYEATVEEPGNIVALGEVTGHKHQFQGDLRTYKVPPHKAEGNTEGNVFTYLVFAPKGAEIRHDSHDPIPVDPGTYYTEIVRQFSPYDEEIRRVAD